MRITSRTHQARKKYFNFLIDLKRNLELGNEITVSQLISKHKISKTSSQILFNLQVIQKTNRRREYIWNDKIPVTQKLANTLLEKTNELNSFHTKASLERRLVKNPLEIKKPETLKRKYKTRAVAVKKNPITKSAKVHNSTQLTTNKVGLIRRFIRWIY